MKEEEKIPIELLKKIKRIELKAGSLVNDLSSGGYTSVFKGQGMEFEEVREYSPGDDVRKIDWNVTARQAAPFVKRYREERELNVLMLVDISGSLSYGSGAKLKKEILLEIASTIAFTASSNQDKIGLLLFTKEIEKYIPPTKQKNAILRIIRTMIFHKPKNRETNIDHAIEYALGQMKRRGIIFIFSDFLSLPKKESLFILSKKHDVIPVIIDDVFEHSIVSMGLVDMIDNETGKRVLVDTNSSSFKNLVAKRLHTRAKLFELFETIRLVPLVLNEKDSIEQALLQYFAKRRKVVR